MNKRHAMMTVRQLILTATPRNDERKARNDDCKAAHPHSHRHAMMTVRRLILTATPRNDESKTRNVEHSSSSQPHHAMMNERHAMMTVRQLILTATDTQ